MDEKKNGDQYDSKLEELGGIGSENAVSALMELFGHAVDISRPHIDILSISELVEAIGHPESGVVGTLLPINGDLSGFMMFVAPEDFTKLMIEALLGKLIGRLDEMDELDLSAIAEVGNIMAGSYLNALSAMTGMRISMDAPGIAIDMSAAVLDMPASVSEEYGDKLLLVKSELVEKNIAAPSFLIIMPKIGYLGEFLKIFDIEL